MNLLAASAEPPSVPPGLVFAVLVLTVAGAAAWVALVGRLRRPGGFLPTAARRAVPWTAGHCGVIVFVYVSSLLIIPYLFLGAQGEQVQDGSEERSAARSSEHVIVQLLRDARGDPAMVLLSVVTAVLLAPICEEFVFRLTLQGYLEGREQRLRRRLGLRRIPRGAISVTVVALAFAAFHARRASPAPDPEVLRYLLMGTGLANLLTIIVGLAVLRWDAQATAADLGWQPGQWRADLKTGLIAFFALATLIYPLQAGLTLLLPKDIAADPLSLVPFALVVGWLYFRVHRLLPSIVVHMALNGMSLVLLWASG